MIAVEGILNDLKEDVLKKMWTEVLSEGKRKMGFGFDGIKEDALKMWREVVIDKKRKIGSGLNGVKEDALKMMWTDLLTGEKRKDGFWP